MFLENKRNLHFSNMLFDGKLKKLRNNGLVSKSFPGKKHGQLQREWGGGGGR